MKGPSALTVGVIVIFCVLYICCQILIVYKQKKISSVFTINATTNIPKRKFYFHKPSKGVMNSFISGVGIDSTFVIQEAEMTHQEEVPPLKSQEPPLLCIITSFKPTKELLKQTAYQNSARMYFELREHVQPFLAINNNLDKEKEAQPSDTQIWLNAGHSMESVVNITETNPYGTPYLGSLISQVETACPQTTSFIGYVNGDILFDQGLINTLELLKMWITDENTPSQNRRIMVVGRRSNHNLAGTLKLKDISSAQSTLFIPAAQDYFIMTRSLIDWAQIPSFVIGRRGYDNALVDWAYHFATLVDATATITALHQSTADGDRAGWSNKDADFNVKLPDVVFDHGSTTDAYFRTALSNGAVIIVNDRNPLRCYCSILQPSGSKENGSTITTSLPLYPCKASATKLYCDNQL